MDEFKKKFWLGARNWTRGWCIIIAIVMIGIGWMASEEGEDIWILLAILDMVLNLGVLSVCLYNSAMKQIDKAFKHAKKLGRAEHAQEVEGKKAFDEEMAK